MYICIVIDDYSRYALAAVVGLEKMTKQTVQQGSVPDEIVTDNGREFTSVWEDNLTKFGQLLAELGITHVTCAPYYPQGNGKAEAFIRTLNRELLQGQTFQAPEELQAAFYLVVGDRTVWSYGRAHPGMVARWRRACFVLRRWQSAESWSCLGPRE